ncbi:zincin [Coprinellus micaceus]|uniref:Zincin n=1 Tax=Coprinellus micaceus TaxID=71717 RepID=A0A4Y7TN77_COPMI|nr:zincin [Coprinellus micaceus]
MSTEPTAAAVPQNTEGSDFPEFYSRCCTTNLSVAEPTGHPRIDGMKAILARAALMWENGRTLTVGFVNPFPGTPTQQAKVKEVVKKWEIVANLKFQFIPNGRDANIRVAFHPRDGSWSYVGKGALSRPRSEPTLNLGWVYSKPGITDDEQGVILHEFGHAIGYLHEHQSPRRGEKLTLNEAGKILARFDVYALKLTS